MRILVMGSGGVGGYFGGLLAKAGEDVGFVARGAHLVALQAEGLRVESVHGDFQAPVRAMSDPAEFGIADLVLFCVKAYDSEAAARLVRPVVAPNTSVLSFQNGVNAVERLEPLLGAGHVLPGIAYVDASIAAPGVIRQPSTYRRLVFGEPRGSISPRVEAIAAALRGSGAEVELRDDIEVALWEKYHHICALSGMTGLTRSPIGPILACPDTRMLYEESVQEVYAVARAAGIGIDPGIVERALTMARTMQPQAASSLHYDLEHGKPLEIEVLSGYLVTLAQRLGVATPVQRVIAGALRLANERQQAQIASIPGG